MQHRQIIKKGVELLKTKRGYSQAEIVGKLETLGKSIAPASLSNIVNDKEVGFPLLKKVWQGIEELVYVELGHRYDLATDDFVFQPDPGWKDKIVPVKGEAGLGGIKFHWEGRAPLPDKAQFIASTQEELIEVGIRLNTFVDYFISHREQLYKNHVEDLLQRGGKFKVYMLDPKANEASIYFTDRAKAQKTEIEALNEMPRIVERLRDVAVDMQKLGAFEIYLYKHIPYNHFFVSDGHLLTGGRMMISHYLYGVKRADCPVMEFSRADNPKLFFKYWDSLQRYVKDAERIQ